MSDFRFGSPEMLEAIHIEHCMEHTLLAQGDERWRIYVNVFECWGGPLGEVPPQCQKAYDNGEPPVLWCPRLNENLKDLEGS